MWPPCPSACPCFWFSFILPFPCHPCVTSHGICVFLSLLFRGARRHLAPSASWQKVTLPVHQVPALWFRRGWAWGEGPVHQSSPRSSAHLGSGSWEGQERGGQSRFCRDKKFEVADRTPSGLPILPPTPHAAPCSRRGQRDHAQKNPPSTPLLCPSRPRSTALLSGETAQLGRAAV